MANDSIRGPHQQTKTVLNRLSRTEGHVRAVRRMVKEGWEHPGSEFVLLTKRLAA